MTPRTCLNRPEVLSLTGLLLVVTLATGVRGATVVRIEDEDLCALAPAIVGGEAVDQLSQEDPETGHVSTWVRFRIDRVLKGEGLPAEITVKVPGGTVPGRTTRVPGAPRFHVGERAILFLRADGNGEGHIMGLTRGKYTIESDPLTGIDWVTQDTRGLNQIVLEGRLAPEHYLMEDGHGRVPLEEFLSTLAQVVSGLDEASP